MPVIVLMGIAIACLCGLVLLLVSWVLHLLAEVEEQAKVIERQNKALPRLRAVRDEMTATLDTRV